MKWALMLVLVLLPVRSWADSTFNREMMFDSLLLVDYAQTRSIFASHGRYVELNPLIARKSVGTYFLSAAFMHSMVTYTLPSQYRRTWQCSTLAIEAAVVGHNAYIGVGLRW